MTEAMAFWSVLLPPKGKPVQQEVESTQAVLSSIHVTGLALGVNPKDGPHVITLEYNGTNTVLATLEAPHTRQCRLDIALDQTVELRNLGDSEVHVYGYQVSTAVHPDEDEESDEDYEMGEEEEGEDEEDEGEQVEFSDEEDDQKTPKAVPLAKRALKAAVAATPNSDAMDTDEDEDEDEDEEDDEDETEDDEDEEDDEEQDEDDGIPDIGDLGSDDMIAEAVDEDEEEGEEEEEEEAKPAAKVGSKRGAQTPQPGKPGKLPKQEPPKSAPPKQLLQQQKQQQKQQPEQKAGSKVIAVTEGGKPQAVKVQKGGASQEDGAKQEVKGAAKGKGEGKSAAKQNGAAGTEQKAGKASQKQPPAAAAQPAGTPKGVKTPSNEAEYLTAVVDFIRSQPGPVSTSNIGNAIKKPAAVAKIGAFLKQHGDKFAVNGDKVSLVKK